MKKELEKLLAEAERLYKIAMDDNVDEDTQDVAYNEYYETNRKIAAWLEKFTMGMINGTVALRMGYTKKAKYWHWSNGGRIRRGAYVENFN